MAYQSLKAALPEIGKIVGTTAHALYTRQRELVRLGLMPSPKGRGPGSGTPITVNTISYLLAAVVISDSIADIGTVGEDVLRRVAKGIRESLNRDGSESAVTYSWRFGTCASGPSIIVDRTLHSMAIAEVAQLLKAS
jgi:hypothetical protein